MLCGSSSELHNSQTRPYNRTKVSCADLGHGGVLFGGPVFAAIEYQAREPAGQAAA